MTLIFTKKFIASATEQFINDFCQVIHGHFWQQFDDALANELAEVFAADEKVTALLMTSTNQNDLHFYVDLVQKNRLANGSERRKQLLTYLRPIRRKESRRSKSWRRQASDRGGRDGQFTLHSPGLWLN